MGDNIDKAIAELKEAREADEREARRHVRCPSCMANLRIDSDGEGVQFVSTADDSAEGRKLKGT